MKRTILNYRIIIEKEQYPDGTLTYNAYCPKLDIADYGDTVEKALSSIKKGVELRLDALAEEKEKVPLENDDVISFLAM